MLATQRDMKPLCSKAKRAVEKPPVIAEIGSILLIAGPLAAPSTPLPSQALEVCCPDIWGLFHRL